MRMQDVSGVSGIGNVANGIELWHGGPCLVKWRGEWGTWVWHQRGLASVRHIHGHDGKTHVVDLDGNIL